MSLSVGIHENLVLSKAEKNERGSLVIGFKQVNEVDPLAMLNSGSGSTSFTQQEQDFLIYPPRLENHQNEIDTPENILDKIAQIVDPLSHILLQYMTKDKVKWAITEGTGVDGSNLKDKITTASVVDKIYSNIVDQFIAMATPFVGSSEKMRMIFIRASQAKHYPALRKRFLDSYPFIERMSIPKDRSKLRFTDYEVKNGYDNPNPVGGGSTISPTESRRTQDLFA